MIAIANPAFAQLREQCPVHRYELPADEPHHALFTRLPSLRLDPEPPAQRDLGRFHTRSWETLPVVWD